MTQACGAIDEAVRPYVEAIGADAAAKLFLKLGGASLYIAGDPKSRSPLVPLIGKDNAIKLALAIGRGHIQLPLGKPFLARHLKAQGWSINAIARELHIQAKTISRHLKGTT